jgi:putative tryptophan/tyrosine transport system substrate-binding protein
MRRREFITLIGGAAAACPIAAHAQQPGMPVIGFMSTLSPENVSNPMAGFHQGLKRRGRVTPRPQDGPAVTFSSPCSQPMV